MPSVSPSMLSLAIRIVIQLFSLLVVTAAVVSVSCHCHLLFLWVVIAIVVSVSCYCYCCFCELSLPLLFLWVVTAIVVSVSCHCHCCFLELSLPLLLVWTSIVNVVTQYEFLKCWYYLPLILVSKLLQLGIFICRFCFHTIEKTELFLELFGNSLVRPQASDYLEQKSHDFIRYLTVECSRKNVNS